MSCNQTQSDIAWFKHILQSEKIVSALKNIKLFVCDVDGTLTNAGIDILPSGEGGRSFSVQDGYIVKHMQKSGITLALMSGKDNISTIQRGKGLGIPEEFLIVGMLEKTEAVQKMQKSLGVSSSQTLIMGDDYLDTKVKLNNAVALYVCPSNTPFYLQTAADIIVPRSGGNSAFRLFTDLLLYVQDKHFAPDMIKKALE